MPKPESPLRSVDTIGDDGEIRHHANDTYKAEQDFDFFTKVYRKSTRNESEASQACHTLMRRCCALAGDLRSGAGQTSKWPKETRTDAASSLVNVHDGLARWKENESNLNDPSAALVQTAETLEDWMAVYDAKKKGGGLDNLSSEILSASAALVKLLPAKSEN